MDRLKCGVRSVKHEHGGVQLGSFSCDLPSVIVWTRIFLVRAIPFMFDPYAAQGRERKKKRGPGPHDHGIVPLFDRLPVLKTLFV